MSLMRLPETFPRGDYIFGHSKDGLTIKISPCTGEYFNSSSSMKKTSIQVHTNDQSSSKPVICHLYEPELTLFSWMNLNHGIPLYIVNILQNVKEGSDLIS